VCLCHDGFTPVSQNECVDEDECKLEGKLINNSIHTGNELNIFGQIQPLSNSKMILIKRVVVKKKLKIFSSAFLSISEL
jgi:hypothetical protein